MKVDKILHQTIERKYVFVTGKFDDVPNNYFISKIEEGITAENNLNYKTNLNRPMTSYDYFTHDQEMLKLLLPIFDLIEKNNLHEGRGFYLDSAWGFKMCFGDYTAKHAHPKSILAGAIGLNKHEQTLYFPQINQEVKSELGSFALFSGFLDHYNNRYLGESVRYGLSFNIEPK